MTLKNNRAPLLCCFQLCAWCHCHMWIQTGVRVRKRLSWVLTSVTLTFDLWPWPFAWTSLLTMVITPENFMMIRWWEHGEKRCDRRTDRQTDGRTDRRTDGRTEWTSHIAACSQLKNPWQKLSVCWPAEVIKKCEWPYEQTLNFMFYKNQSLMFQNNKLKLCWQCQNKLTRIPCQSVKMLSSSNDHSIVFWGIAMNLVLKQQRSSPNSKSIRQNLWALPLFTVLFWGHAKNATSFPLGQNGRHFADDISRCIFVNAKFYIMIKISLKCVHNGTIDNNPAFV